MIPIDFSGRTVLITGGTKGIGLAAGLQFGQAGANVYLTCKWHSADEEQVRRQFTAVGAKPPTILEADASLESDTAQVIEEIAKRESGVDVFISNVGVAQKVADLDAYKRQSLFKTLDYSAWPIIEYTRRIRARFGRYPEYVLGVSSDGPDHFYPGYDFVAASKALLEVLAKYLAVHVLPSACRVNVVRFGPVRTESFAAFFQTGFFDQLRESVPPHRQLTPEACGRTLLALCSGLLDAMHGQVITVDHGLPFADNALQRYMAGAAKRG